MHNNCRKLCTEILRFVMDFIVLSNYYSKWLFILVPLEAVQQLSVEIESVSSVRVRWRGVSGVRAYRLVWGPITGQEEATIWQHIVHPPLSPVLAHNSLFHSRRSKCGDRGTCWWKRVLCFVRPAAWHWIYRHYHLVVWGRHWGLCSDNQVQDR